MAKQTLWTVVHYDHAGNALGEVSPEGFGVQLILDKVGSTSYNIDLSNSLANETNCRPYYTDYIVKRGSRNIQAGIHTAVNIDDTNSNQLQVGGQDWLHYFEGCFWPFDPLNPTTNLYSAFGKDVVLVVKDFLDTILAQPNRLSFAYNLVAAGQTTNYKIDVADTTDLLQRISDLSQTKPGFDFDVSADLTRTFSIYAPKKGITNTLFVFDEANNIEIVSWQNEGPTGTYMLATASTASGGQSGVTVSATNQGVARRWDVAETFDTVSDASQLSTYASGQIDRDSADRITFTCKYVPQENEDFWGEVSIGDSYRVRLGLGGYKSIDDYFRLVGIQVDISDEGEEEIECTFDYGTLSL